MNAADATRQLDEIADAGDDFEWESRKLTAKWQADPKGFEALEPILRFMEGHPDVDYGAPGPLVHFVEPIPNYEEKLMESVERRPTSHTVGMINRVINGKSDLQERQAVMSVLERVLENESADEMTRERARDYLYFQRRDA